jgi:asparagine synthase (glutamine-hydrolysing)
MNGISGIIDLQGRRIGIHTLTAVRGETVATVRKEEGIWQQADAAFWHVGTQAYTNPLEDDELVLLCAARLDNKEELYISLGLTHTAEQSISDNHLILKAYRQWGPACVEHLIGEWSFAVWHKQERTLFLARDHFGNTGLYFYKKNGLFVFSSFLKPLLAIPGFSSAPNDEYIAALLTCFLPEGTGTIYDAIRRIPPAHNLTVTSNGVHLHRYYYLEHTPSLRLARDEDYVEAFQEIFTRAVKDRIRDRDAVGVTLSGGLDSGAVAVTAANILKSDSKTLRAFCHVPFYDTSDALDAGSRFGDESPYVKKVAARAGNIEVDWVDSEDLGPVQGQRRLLDCFPEPIFGAANSFWLFHILDRARAQGIDTLLTGQMGNATLSWSGAGGLASLARTGSWATLFTQIRAISAARSISMGRVFASQVCLPFTPPFLYRFYSRYKRGQGSVTDYSAIHPEFVKKIHLLERMRDCGHDPLFKPVPDTRKMRYKIIHPGSSPIGCLWHELGHAMGVRVLDPTLDKRVMEFCLAIPDDQYLKDGTDRRLVRRAFDGQLPDEVLRNPRKGLQSADIVSRIRHFHQEVETALDDIEHLDLARQYLDLKKMRDVFRSLDGPMTPSLTFTSGAILMRGLMIGLCLQKYFK